MKTEIKSIKVYGSGCPSCKKLFETTKLAAKELNLDIEVEYVNDIQKLLDLGVMSSPVMTINDKPVLAGQIPGLEKVKEIINNYQAH